MRQRKDAAEHRRQILLTAQALFSEHGVDSVSMHQIAKTAGIGQGTLYRNYINKADLCMDIIRECAQRVENEIVAELERNRNAPVRQKLELMLFRMLDFIEEKSQWLGAMQTPPCPEGRMSYYHSPIYKILHGRMEKLIAEGIERQECSGSLDPAFTADAILAAVDPDFYLFLRRGRGYSLEIIKSNLRTVYLEPLFAAKG